MRTSTAYFAGVGTVIFAVMAGLGGGYLAANVVAPHEPKYGAETSLLERRMSSQPIPVQARSEPVQIVPLTNAAAAPVSSPAQPTIQVASSSSAAVPAEESPVVATSAAAPESAGEKAVTAQEDVAKARAEESRRAAAEKRRAERRQRVAEQRRMRQLRDQELEAVEQRVREIYQPRQAFAFDASRNESPRMRMFGLD
jgi:type IV secretory pathway TrbL component